MPPALVSDDEGSEVEAPPSPPPRARTKGRKSETRIATPKESEEEEETPQTNGDGDDEEDDDEGDDEEGYAVEKIVDHKIEGRKVFFLVKWENYPDDQNTWEEEANFAGTADDALEAYLDTIGGRAAITDQLKKVPAKKRGRQSAGAPPSTKRAKTEHPADSEPPETLKKMMWKPPSGTWDDEIAQIDACEDEATGKLMVYLQWKNGKKTVHGTQEIYKRCPQKMLQYYERHVRIVKNAPPGHTGKASRSASVDGKTPTPKPTAAL